MLCQQCVVRVDDIKFSFLVLSWSATPQIMLTRGPPPQPPLPPPHLGGLPAGASCSGSSVCVVANHIVYYIGIVLYIGTKLPVVHLLMTATIASVISPFPRHTHGLAKYCLI